MRADLKEESSVAALKSKLDAILIRYGKSPSFPVLAVKLMGLKPRIVWVSLKYILLSLGSIDYILRKSRELL